MSARQSPIASNAFSIGILSSKINKRSSAYQMVNSLSFILFIVSSIILINSWGDNIVPCNIPLLTDWGLEKDSPILSCKFCFVTKFIKIHLILVDKVIFWTRIRKAE
eukprot:NODE_848_length_3547_cov_0.613399.p3 type:complete len:107 gc:universal NODE_848_length_3547_cov_0.613399:1405-1725(+)